MKNNDLLEAMGDIKDEYVTEAEPKPKGKNTKKIATWTGVAALAAAACFVIFIAGRSENGGRWPVKEIIVDTNETIAEIETAIVSRWENKNICEKYTGFEYDDKEYHTANYENGILQAELVETLLGTVTMKGYDIYTDTEYTTEAEIYTIKDILSECAVVVKFAEDDNYHVYRNSWYKPATLGEFIDALNLRENLSVGTVYYDYFDKNNEHVNVEFTGLTVDKVFEMLLFDGSIANVENYDTMWFHRIMGISVNVEVLGYKNISIAVTEEGYVTTNILDTGKAFYIGEEKVHAFVDYVMENCEGLEIRYIYETEADKVSADGGVEEIIIMHTDGSTEIVTVGEPMTTSEGEEMIVPGYDPNAEVTSQSAPAQPPQNVEPETIPE